MAREKDNVAGKTSADQAVQAAGEKAKREKKPDRFPHITFKNRITRACCRAVADGLVTAESMSVMLKGLSEDFRIMPANPTGVVG